ncbi:MAG: copper chaperone PCu(A)C [Burkholderiaceae bacterium]
MKHMYLILALLTSLSTAVQARDVTIEDAWIRVTMRLIGVSSDIAGVNEIHQMKVENDVMKMSAVPFLDLPAGQTVQLKPGGYHLMFMDLKQNVPQGTEVPLTLTFENASGERSSLQINLPARLSPAKGGMRHGQYR